MQKGDTVYWRQNNNLFIKAKVAHIFTEDDKVNITERGNDFRTVNKKDLVPDYIYESPLYRSMKEFLHKQEVKEINT
jgi:hypothetical protein